MKLILASMAVLIASDFEQTDIADLASHLKQQGYRKIGVFPEVVQEDDQGHLQFTKESLLSRKITGAVRAELQDLAGDSYEVAEEKAVLNAAWDCCPADLQEKSVWRRIAKETGCQGIILVLCSEGKRSNERNLRLRLLKAGEEEFQAREPYALGLSDLAFSGASHVWRRLEGGALDPTGFDKEVDPNFLVGIGPNYDLIQGGAVRSDDDHPLESPDCPIEIQFLVNDRLRPLEKIGDEYFVRLDEGETLVIGLSNRHHYALLIGLYIDGINTIGRKFEYPQHTPTGRHWRLGAEKRGFVNGWYSQPDTGIGTRQSEGPQSGQEEPFEIVRRSIEADQQRRLGDAVGMITAMIYTDGLDGIKNVPGGDLPTRGDQVQIGWGKARSVYLEHKLASKGSLLTSLTVHYRCATELEAMRGRPSVQPVTSGPLGEDKPHS